MQAPLGIAVNATIKGWRRGKMSDTAPIEGRQQHTQEGSADGVFPLPARKHSNPRLATTGGVSPTTAAAMDVGS